MPEIEVPVQVEGDEETVETTTTVDTDEIEGIIHEDEFDDRFSDELERRVQSRTEGLRDPDELRQDEDFVREVATENTEVVVDALGIDPEDRDMPDPDAIREEVREQVRREEVEPLQEELETVRTESQQRIEDLLEDRLSGRVAEAATKWGVKSSMVDLVRAMIRQNAEWSEEHGQFVVLDEEGEPKVSTRDGTGPYRTIDEEIEARYRSGDHSDWFEESAREGVGAEGGASGPGRHERVTLEDFKEMGSQERLQLRRDRPDRYMELQEERRQEGIDSLSPSGR